MRSVIVVADGLAMMSMRRRWTGAKHPVTLVIEEICAIFRELGFTVAPEVVAAMTEMAGRIEIISAERVRDELVKTVCAPHPRLGLSLLVETGLADLVLPELPALKLERDEHHRHKDVYEHTLTVLEQAIDLEPRLAERAGIEGPDFVSRFAALMHDVGKPRTRRFQDDGAVTFHHHDVVGAKITRKRMQALRFSGDQIDALAWHEWMVRDLLATRVYRNSVRQAADLVGLDNQGRPRKALLLDQTNISSGSSLSPYDQETHYAALWWTSVAINASADGWLDMLNWFQSADEPEYPKGMVRVLDNQRFELKPVGLAQQFIQQHWLDQVLRLLHPALPSCPGHEHWLRDFDGASGLFAFVLNAGEEAAGFEGVDGKPLTIAYNRGSH